MVLASLGPTLDPPGYPGATREGLTVDGINPALP